MEVIFMAKISFYDTVQRVCDRTREYLSTRVEQKDPNFLKVEDRLEYMAQTITSHFKVRRGEFAIWESHSMNTVQTLMIFDEELFIWRPYKDFSNAFCYGAYVKKDFNGNAKSLADLIDVNNGMNPQDVYVPEAYRGTRYQLFMNGIYDIKEDVLIHPTKDTKLNYRGEEVPITEIGFTFKHLHRINFPEGEPNEPIYYGKGPNGSNWDFRHWLSLLCNDDDEKKTWLLAIIGLCSLPNTNVGVNVMLKGQSGSGKSVIGKLIQTIYCGYDDKIRNYIRVEDDALVNDKEDAETFNADYPFRTSLSSTTNFVHVREMNGTEINEKGSMLYDKFADDAMDAIQLHKESGILNPTPTLYMEGTDWARFTTVKNGVQRRTLPFEITQSKELIHYTVDNMKKNDVFASSTVIDWLVVYAFKALRFLFPTQVENLQINLNSFELPRFMSTYMGEIMSGGNEINAFFDDFLSYTLICDENKFISYEFLHFVFRKFENQRGYTYIKALPTFVESIDSVLNLHGYKLEYHALDSIKRTENLALDVKEAQELVDLAEEFDENYFPTSRYAKIKSHLYTVKRIDDEDPGVISGEKQLLPKNEEVSSNKEDDMIRAEVDVTTLDDLNF